VLLAALASTAFAREGSAPNFSAAPAVAGLFDAYDAPRHEIARPDAPSARKRHKTKRGIAHFDRHKVPVGPLHIIISIAKQRATLFSNGVRIAEAPISTGVPGHPTPMGVFSVISKARYHKSNIYSGAPMPYMQRITWSGIALHQGPLPGFPASHGCIRLPEAFAVKLWALSKVGARVIVTRDETAPFKIENARLFVPKKPEEKPAIVAEVSTSVMTALTVTIVEPAAADDIAKLPNAARSTAEQQKRKGPVQVFVSRKEAKLYVRQDFAPLFDAPVTVAAPDEPWGTHVFTLMDIKDGKPDWSAVTIPSGYALRPDRHSRKLSAKEFERRQKRADELANAPTAAKALERFELPQDAVERISELLTPGSALIVSDNALSDETGQETDFIVLTQ
jgi:hypothetical protein